MSVDGARIYRFGETGIVLELDKTLPKGQQRSQAAITSLGSMLRRTLCGEASRGDIQCATAAVHDIVPADGNLTVFFDPDKLDVAALCKQVATAWCSIDSENAVIHGRRHRLAVQYGGEFGPDLASLAGELSLGTAELVARHLQGCYTVCFIGFQPGFAYLEGLHTSLHAPRRISPRRRVAPNSLAIGGPYTAIYPFASPGGWHIIGRYLPGQNPLFDPNRPQSALLQPGDTVCFEHTC